MKNVDRDSCKSGKGGARKGGRGIVVHQAVMRNDAPEVKAYLRTGIDKLSMYSEANTPIEVACELDIEGSYRPSCRPVPGTDGRGWL